jgi:hypothetical protein
VRLSDFWISATEESGRWVCAEARAKLNAPGQQDGEAALWIDGILPKGIYFLRCRQQGSDGIWSDWSPWHQPIRVE